MRACTSARNVTREQKSMIGAQSIFIMSSHARAVHDVGEVWIFSVAGNRGDELIERLHLYGLVHESLIYTHTL